MLLLYHIFFFKKMRGVGIEPTRIAPADLKPATLTTRSSSQTSEDDILARLCRGSNSGYQIQSLMS